jgi:hypothetical protein
VIVVHVGCGVGTVLSAFAARSFTLVVDPRTDLGQVVVYGIVILVGDEVEGFQAQTLYMGRG